MDERVRADRLGVWALATLHATLFVTLLSFAIYRSGDLGERLARLGTLPGFALFLSLWALAAATHAEWLRRLRPVRRSPRRSGLGVAWLRVSSAESEASGIETGAFLGGAIAWGAATGVGFLAALVVVEVAAGRFRPDLFFPLPFAAMFAAAIGAVVGLLCGLLDFFLFALASLLTRR